MMDLTFMREAIRLSVENANQGGGPFGAIIVKDGKIISRGVNRVVQLGDPTAHAEILAIRDACKKLGKFELDDCVIYSSCEPCPMCMGAILWARIPVLFYACSRDDARGYGFKDADFYDEMSKPECKSNLVMKRLLRDEALEAFKKWEENPHKKIY